MRIATWAMIGFVGFAPLSVAAQDQTLADIRQELTILHVEVQRLKRELSTTGGPSVQITGDSVLERVTAMETELQRLTALTEQQQFRIDRIVTDGTNRIGDLEFRLVELEGGDVGKLGQTTTLGGEVPGQPQPAAPAPSSDTPGTELAVGEDTDFRAAEAAMAEGNHQKAADLLAEFNTNYPGSPLAAQAGLQRGKALEALGDTREAARAYLASFTADTAGPVAPDALFELGAALGRLGQQSQACVTLGEVGTRFPDSALVARARDEMARLGCS